nr:hypothetical protein [Tanacetum cinerariifolium]
MSSLADKAILSGADNRPPMLEKDMYDSWRSRMELYMLNRQHGKMILKSVEHGPLLWPTIAVEGVTRLKKYSELSAAEAIQADCDVKATNIILQALPPEIYALERECKLYDAFDKFAYQKGETLRDFYLRFSLLLNDMNMYNMKLEQFQVNTKFLNTLPPEWSKFVTDVKLVRDLHTTNVDQLHAYLGQQEYYANEVRLMHERTSDPLALVSQHQLYRPTYQHHHQSYHQPQFQQQASTYQTSQYATSYHNPQFVSQGPSSSTHSISYPVTDTSSLVNHNAYMASSSAPQIDYAPMVQHSSEYSPPETGLMVPVFQKGDDPIDAINHMMSFLTAVVTSRYPATNNQLCTSSKPPDDLDAYDSDCDEINSAKIALMVNLSHYGYDNLVEIELSTEQAFWSQYSVQTDEPNLSTTTTIVEVLKKLPKVVMVNSCLKKLKSHLASFDMELFTSFDQYLIDEVTEVQHVFKEIELAVEQHREEKNNFQNKMEHVLQENDQLLTQAVLKL